MLTRRQQWDKLFSSVTALLVENARKSVPERGSFHRVTVGGHINGVDYHSILGIEESYRSEAERRVTLGVYREGSDKLVSNYLFKGSLQEVLAWLESPEGLAQILQAYAHLEEKVKGFD